MEKSGFALLALALFAFVLAAGCAGTSQPPPESSQFTYDNVTVMIITANGNISVHAQVAKSQEQQEFGLMYRESLAEGSGMIFPFAQAGNYGFYMKNMKIPLDIIYAKPVQDSGNGNQQGTGNPANGMNGKSYQIIKITRNFQPCKSDPCPIDYSGGGADMVLEVPAGYAKAHGIKEGDVLLISGGTY